MYILYLIYFGIIHTDTDWKFGYDKRHIWNLLDMHYWSRLCLGQWSMSYAVNTHILKESFLGGSIRAFFKIKLYQIEFWAYGI